MQNLPAVSIANLNPDFYTSSLRVELTNGDIYRLVSKREDLPREEGLSNAHISLIPYTKRVKELDEHFVILGIQGG